MAGLTESGLLIPDCYVYIVSERDGEYVKVGIAERPEIRLGGLQTGNPRLLSLAFAERFPNKLQASQVEYRAHRLLFDHSASGEWFKCSADVAIDAVQAARKYVRNRRGNLGYDYPTKRRRDLGAV